MGGFNLRGQLPTPPVHDTPGPAAFLSPLGPPGADGPQGIPGPTGPGGGSVSALERYANGTDKLAAAFDPMLLDNAGTNPSANRIFLQRVVMPKSGTLKALQTPIVTSSGNYRGLVYDNGVADPTKLTRLDALASTAVAASGKWGLIGNPNNAVTKGDVLWFGLQFDNGAVSVGRRQFPAGGAVDGFAGILLADGVTYQRGATHYDPGSYTAPGTILISALAATPTQAIPMMAAWVV